jgi:hypothetical protein
MTQSGRRDDDFQVYVWKSSDLGTTWKDLSSNVPLGPVNVIREDPEDEDRLFIGTDAGVYVSKDGGETWAVLGDLPFVYVHDLVIHPRDDMLVIATHGRGMWTLKLEELDEKKATGLDSAQASEEDIEALLGTWNGEVDADGMILPFSLELVMEDDEIGGSMSFVMGRADVSDVLFDGENLELKATMDMGEEAVDVDLEGRLEDGKMTGKGSSMMGKMKFEAKKEGAEAPAPEEGASQPAD